MNVQWLVLAKAPVPGRVKTRLCPPCTPEQAALLAAAALADTLTVVARVPAAARTLVVHGDHRPPAGWRLVAQRGSGLPDRLHHAFADTRRPGVASLLVGMDTPQLTAGLLQTAVAALDTPGVDAVLGPADDGGWWLLGLRDPAHAAVLRTVATSTDHTGADTRAALHRRGLRVAQLPALRDVDTAADARAVALRCPAHHSFPRAVTTHLPTTAGRP
jgi:rSAM/selenodomain-associated transferase 1